ncbi:MAG: hypothetical protein ACE5JU_05125 [Candidatus Binatia bacterium]
MKLPHRDSIDLGPLAYGKFLKREGLPVITGYFVEDVMKVEVKPWERMGALGCCLNLADQQLPKSIRFSRSRENQTLPGTKLTVVETPICQFNGNGSGTVVVGVPNF